MFKKLYKGFDKMRINMSGSGQVIIDGKSFHGNNISIVNGKVIVDGKTQDGDLTGEINIVVNGDVNSIENRCGNVQANNVGEISTGSGDITCGNVSGSVRTGSGDVSCGDVGGNIRTGSGDVYRK